MRLNLRRLLPAFVGSGAFHGLVVLALTQVTFFSPRPAFLETQVIETRVDDPDGGLEDDEIGLDPDVPIDFNVTRIEEISVPGRVHAEQPVGIAGAMQWLPWSTHPHEGDRRRAPELPPHLSVKPRIVPPPGFEGDRGQGRGLEGGIGKGAMFGRVGGWESQPAHGSQPFRGASGATRERMIREAGGNAGVDLTPPPQVWQRDPRRPTFARVYIGNGNALELISQHVSGTVEGPRARVLVDHVFRNPHDRRLEGTFEYPLPTGASPCYYAMFLGPTRGNPPPRFQARGAVPPLGVLPPAELAQLLSTDDWGPLQEARVVPPHKALETYEEIVRGRIDPALLEYAAGNTFRGRVFPIPPHGYNRILIAYEELLPIVQDRALFRFALPDCPLAELQVALQARAREASDAVFRPADARRETSAGQVTYTRSWQGKGPGGEVVFTFPPAQPTVQAISGRQGENGPHYLYARLRPELPAAASPAPFARHAVFLLDTSLSEHPDRFAVGMKLLHKVLASDPDIGHFNILGFNVGASWLESERWLPNTAAGREQALARLDGLVLEGATDLSAALEGLAQAEFIAAGTPVNVFLLSDGQVTWGEPHADPLAARFEKQCPFPTRFHCYRTGLGADNGDLFQALTRKGGGVFNCFSEAALAAAARAHRNPCWQIERVRFEGGPAVSDILVAGRQAAVYPGGELIVAGRSAGPGQTRIVVEGLFQGQKRTQASPSRSALTATWPPAAGPSWPWPAFWP